MSKFKAKDLTYDASQPAFLQRLRGQIAGGDSARHEVAIPRSKRLVQDDEEDAPTYVLEDTNHSLTKAEYDALIAGKDEAPDEVKPATAEGKETDTSQTTKDNIAEVGRATKKRKAVKIVGDGLDDGADGAKADTETIKKTKPKKKAKKVKLSFGDQEEG